jgi:hypothetical protein
VLALHERHDSTCRHVAPKAALLVCETDSDQEKVQCQAGHKILVLDKQKRKAKLVMPRNSWNATIVLVDRPVTHSRGS